jgi:selenocysteine-specific elongation factor
VELRAALDRVAETARSRAGDTGEARLHIDRAFTIRGAGTVVTGTLWAGCIARGDSLQLLPGRRRARARDVQVHDQSVSRALAGQRVAVNLSGLAVADVSRGDVVVNEGAQLDATYLIDAQLEFRRAEPAHGARVQVHHGTRESAARLAWLGGPFWQIRLEQPLIPAARDHLVIRQIAPPDTLGGGVVLDAHPRKHGPSRAALTRLQRLARGEAPGDDAPPIDSAPSPVPVPVPSPLSPSALETEARLREAAFEPPLDAELDAGDLAALRAAGRAVRVSQTLHYHPDTIADVKRRVLAVAGGPGGSITLAQLRDELDTSRKYAQALLEHLDTQRLTIRRGDRHFVRRQRDPG